MTAEGRSGLCLDEITFEMLYAVIDIHKHAFQAAVLDPERACVFGLTGPARASQCHIDRGNPLVVEVCGPLVPRH